MSGARVLVTGASKGIGRSTALALSRSGFEVLGTARRPSDCSHLPPNVRFLPLDLEDEPSIDACLEVALPVDILVNNAGGSSVWAAAEAPPDALRRMFQLNFFGPVRLIQGLLPAMLGRGSGFILNIGSLVWRFGLPYQSAYAASKAALAAYSLSLRKEVAARGVRVVTLDPGDVRTTIEPSALRPFDPEFQAGYDAFFRRRNTGMDKAAAPDIVAEKILAVLRKKRPSPFYTAGKGAAVQAAFKRFFPEAEVERQVQKRFGPSRPLEKARRP